MGSTPGFLQALQCGQKGKNYIHLKFFLMGRNAPHRLLFYSLIDGLHCVGPDVKRVFLAQNSVLSRDFIIHLYTFLDTSLKSSLAPSYILNLFTVCNWKTSFVESVSLLHYRIRMLCPGPSMQQMLSTQLFSLASRCAHLLGRALKVCGYTKVGVPSKQITWG